MTRDDLRIFCTALGFTAVILKDVPADNQALPAASIARLIESFCHVTIPDAFSTTGDDLDDESASDSVDRAIDRYKAELGANESAHLPQDRQSLLKFYDRLLTRKARRERRDFYATGSGEIIADQILRLVEDEIEQDGGKQ